MRSARLLVFAAAMAACTSASPLSDSTQPAPTSTAADSAGAERMFLESLPGYIVTYDTTPTVYTPQGASILELTDAIPGAQPTFASNGSLAWTASDGVSQFVRTRLPDGTIFDAPPPMIPFYYYWSPDSTRLAFLGNGPSGQVEVAIIGSAGEIILTDAGSPYFFDWAPDGTAIAAHVSGDTLRIYPIDSDPVDVRVSPNFGSPQWSTDGITWLGTGSLSASLGNALTQTTEPLFTGDPIADDPVAVAQVGGAASFAAAAGRLAILDGLPIGSLTVIEEGTVTEVSDNVGAYQWSPDGSDLAFLQFFPQEGLARWLVWNADETLAFERFTPTPQFVGIYLPFWDQYIRSQTIWSPDGQAFVYAASTQTGFEIRVQPVGKDRPAVAIASGGFASWGPVSFAP